MKDLIVKHFKWILIGAIVVAVIGATIDIRQKEKMYPLTGAKTGEKWFIMDSSVTVMAKPELKLTPNGSFDKEEFILNMVVTLNPNTNVKILDTKGIDEQWVQVRVYRAGSDLVSYAEGWIQCASVRNATRVE